MGWSGLLCWSLGCGQLLGEVEISAQEEDSALSLSVDGTTPGSGTALAPPARTVPSSPGAPTSTGAGSAGAAGAPGAETGATGTPGAGQASAGGAAGTGNVSLPLCDPGESRCQGTRLEECGADATWQVLDGCATPVLCELSRSGGASACVLPACAAGERRCEGGAVLVCNAAQTELVVDQTCAENERCEPRTGCDPLPCTPGERRCNGARIELCDAQAGDFIASGEECASAQLCSESSAAGLAREVRCLEPVCPAGQFRCVGALLQRCSDGRNAWLDFAPCASAELCDARLGAQGCAPPACEAGALSCVGDTLLRCRPGRDGSDVVAECALAGGCDPLALVCRDPCVVGAARCNGAFLETCEDVLVGWQRRACESAELCDAATRSCLAPSCQASDRGCRGAQPQRCAPGRDGLIDVGPPCASAALCDPVAGTCAEPACAAGETRCDGLNQLLTCNAGQTGFDAVACEGLLGLCDPGPPAQCRSLL